jgi:hypothetical protein
MRLLVVVLLFLSSVSHAKVWEVKNQWNWEWEQRYSEWFQKTFTDDTLDIFEKQEMATDCADAAIASRWIFARKYGLPVLHHSATMFITDKDGNRTREMYSQDTMKRHWVKLGLKTNPKGAWHTDELFVTALNYVLDNTNTYSLSWDSYPVEISPKSMLKGTHHLTFYPKGAHANILYNFEEFSAKKGLKKHKTIALNMLNSTLPKAVRKLFKRHYTRGERPSKRGNEGFLRMRWPVKNSIGSYELLNRDEHPYWSEEQYEESFMEGHGSFYQAVTARLWSNYKFNYADLSLLIKFINNALGKRIYYVVKGYNLCVDDLTTDIDDDNIEDCSPGTKNYDLYSTNNSDDKFQALMTAANRTFNMYKNKRPYKQTIKSFLNGTVKLSNQESANFHQIEFKHIIDAFTLQEFMTVKERREAEFQFSSDPRDDFYVRWGVQDLF